MRKPLRLYSRMPLRMLPLTLRHRDMYVLEALIQSTLPWLSAYIRFS
jgi:hypothetical protein